MGAPVGNQNAKKAKLWEQALKRALARIVDEPEKTVEKGLDKCADKLVSAAVGGEQWALREIGDRIDGKPIQVVAGDPDQPLEIREIVIRSVDATRD
jgi:hypothetical protein